MSEAELHPQNTFITLTYSDHYLPSDGSLNYQHFQLFMKKLRRYLWRNYGKSLAPKIKYYVAGEYGSVCNKCYKALTTDCQCEIPEPGLGRPHFHAILFNWKFPDQELFREYRGNKYYISKILQKLWPEGYSIIGDVTFESTAYVARYVMKKINGDMADDHYKKMNRDTGEIHNVSPEFNRMSLKPAIAKDWFLKFQTDVFPHDHIVKRGKTYPVPDYFLRLYKHLDEAGFESVKEKRIQRAVKNKLNSTPKRLAVREKVQSHKLKRLKRSLA